MPKVKGGRKRDKPRGRNHKRGKTNRSFGKRLSGQCNDCHGVWKDIGSCDLSNKLSQQYQAEQEKCSDNSVRNLSARHRRGGRSGNRKFHA